jgi:hypothetical protein
MYMLLRLVSNPRNALQQLLALAPAWMIAESFYRFHSFTLESAAFLTTWLAFDVVITRVAGRGSHVWPESST